MAQNQLPYYIVLLSAFPVMMVQQTGARQRQSSVAQLTSPSCDALLGNWLYIPERRILPVAVIARVLFAYLLLLQDAYCADNRDQEVGITVPIHCNSAAAGRNAHLRVPSLGHRF